MMLQDRQIVFAQKRGDACYEGKMGWFHHEFDDQKAIDTPTIRGPFQTQALAAEDVLWWTFREINGPRPMGRHAQFVWEAQWEAYKGALMPEELKA
jgi:hypothetical protein